MNKGFLICLLGIIAFLPGFQCKKNVDPSTCYKARLEIKGMCMNYTIKVLSSNIATDLIEREWKNPHTGITYQNVFRLGSVCDFPTDLKEGDEFYFQLASRTKTDCIACMAYYPTPSKALNISVSKTPCE